uniref:Ig-like domain-containing protein n=1 Tax=Neolamprologus brichardi TaxID=32507 RepID=A0A3Q4NBE6_NEOBR
STGITTIIISLGLQMLFPSDAPKLPSVSVSPSAEIVEGSSVTLTCSSDANPAASYTWYKEDEDSPKASGHNFTITDITPEHSGSYSCVAQNNRGHHYSTLQLTVSKSLLFLGYWSDINETYICYSNLLIVMTLDPDVLMTSLIIFSCFFCFPVLWIILVFTVIIQLQK